MASGKAKNYISFKPGRGPGDLDRTVAERDKILSFYYVDPERYVARAIDRDDRASVFIGPKGAGKSAVLEMVRTYCKGGGNEERILDIAPDDLAFSALANINASTPILAAAHSNQWLFTSLWDYILSVEILRKEYRDRNLLSSALQRLFGTKSTRQQDQLLSLALSDKGTPKESLTQKMLDLVEAVELEANVHAVSGKVTLKPGERATSHLDLLRLVNNVAKDLATTVKGEYYVLVDDLDLHWTGSELQNAFIGALFSSIAKLGRSRNIKFVVALRQNIFSKIGIEDRDKLRDIVVRVDWGEQALMDMVSRWLAFVLTATEKEVWSGMFPDNAFKRLYGATSGKPREIIRLAALCVRKAKSAGQKKIRNEDITAASEEFSKDRLEDLSSEYRYAYPGLDHICLKFAGKKKEFAIEQLEEVALELAAEIESNQAAVHAWSGQFVDDAVSFARMLLQCGFVQFKAHKADHAHTPTDVEIANLKRENWFAIHPMYAIGLSAR